MTRWNPSQHPRQPAGTSQGGQFRGVEVRLVKPRVDRVIIRVNGKEYDPNQPRVPRGDPRGGQWTSGGTVVEIPAHWQKWQASLTDEERSAIGYYTEGGFSSINDSLRKGGYASQEDRDAIHALDSALDKARADKEMVVYRGICSSPECVAGFEWMEEGDTFTDDGFASATTVGSESFSAQVTAEIIVPKGARGAYLEGVTSYVGQHEFLIPRGAEYEIASISRSEWGIDLRLRLLE